MKRKASGSLRAPLTALREQVNLVNWWETDTGVAFGDHYAQDKQRKGRAPDPPGQIADGGTGYVKVPRVNEAFVPVHLRIQGILAEYYKIDEDEAERERLAVLDYVRAMNDWED